MVLVLGGTTSAQPSSPVHRMPAVPIELLTRAIGLRTGIGQSHDAVSTSSTEAQQFYDPKLVNGRMDFAGGMTKTFPLRGIKESAPYLHDGRLLTLEDTVEYFNLVLGLKLNDQEKQDLVAFMRAL